MLMLSSRSIDTGLFKISLPLTCDAYDIEELVCSALKVTYK